MGYYNIVESTSTKNYFFLQFNLLITNFRQKYNDCGSKIIILQKEGCEIIIIHFEMNTN